jgi:hypothetical protein
MITKEFVVTINDAEKTFIIKSPSINDQREATKAYNQTFSDAIKSKAIVRAKIDELLKEQGLWDDEKQIKLDQFQSEILYRERKLAEGGISLLEAKKIALEIKDVRSQIRDLIAIKMSLDNNTAEGQADNARFNYLVSACTVYKDNNQPYFRNMEDYLDKSTSEVAIKAAQTLANMMYGLDNNYEANLPENKFLKQYKFIDSKLRLINKEGKLVDQEGRLIDENGRFIDSEGNFVDKNGFRVDQDGEYVLEAKPFLDEEGKPIILEDKKQEDKNNEQSITENPQTSNSEEVSTQK